MTNRTVTLPTTDHGPVTLPEPSWCCGHSGHQPTAHRIDIEHQGPEHRLTHNGALLWTAYLAQAPYARTADARAAVLFVEQDDYTASLDPVGLYGLAASLDAHADQLRALADELTAILATERGDA